MGLNAQEKAALDALLAKEQADDDEEFEIEIWSGQDGARVPYRKGKDWFEKTFGVSLGNPTDDSSGKASASPRKRTPPKQDSSKADDDSIQEPPEGVLRHFGRQSRAAS